jgi:hypothetical protein
MGLLTLLPVSPVPRLGFIELSRRLVSEFDGLVTQ